jgi:hypothetical protein
MTYHGNARTERFTRRERKGNGQGHDEAVPSRLVLVLRLSFFSHLHPRTRHVASNTNASEHHARPPEAKQRPAGKRDTRGAQTSLSCARMRAHTYRSSARMHPRGPAHTACARGLTCPRSCFQIGLVSNFILQM